VIDGRPPATVTEENVIDGQPPATMAEEDLIHTAPPRAVRNAEIVFRKCFPRAAPRVTFEGQ
jgi:hypothetical protein